MRLTSIALQVRRTKYLKKVDVFTDGSCLGNPGPGGWGAILRYNGYEKEIFGSQPVTTNNRMELIAVIEALKLLKEPCKITIYSDSKYLCDAILKGWAKKWQSNGWRRSDKSPALNSDLWGELLALIDKHNVEIVWVKGHAGHPENERCDKLAVSAAAKASQRSL